MNIEYAREPMKVLRRLDGPAVRRIREGIQGLPDGDVKALQGAQGHYRLRIGDWRIVFTYPDRNTVRIERIAPRGEAYKGV